MNGSGNTGRTRGSTWEAEAIEPPENCNSMMDRREALLLVDRHKRRDPDVLTLCEYVHGTDVHGTIPAFRRPGDGTPPAVFPSALCPVCAAPSGGRDGEEKK